MILNITFGTDVANAPPEFKTAVAAVQQFFEASFTNPVTVNIQVDYGHLGHDLLGQSSYGLNTYSFSQITAALTQNSFLAFSGTGVVNAVTPTDLRVMDVLGWDSHRR